MRLMMAADVPDDYILATGRDALAEGVPRARLPRRRDRRLARARRHPRRPAPHDRPRPPARRQRQGLRRARLAAHADLRPDRRGDGRVRHAADRGTRRRSGTSHEPRPARSPTRRTPRTSASGVPSASMDPRRPRVRRRRRERAAAPVHHGEPARPRLAWAADRGRPGARGRAARAPTRRHRGRAGGRGRPRRTRCSTACPGTGLGTLDAGGGRGRARRGFDVEQVARARPTALDAILDGHDVGDVHFMSIDVEGAEAVVLQGLSLERHRPWVLCVEAVLPGTTTPSHEAWEPRLPRSGYRFVAFDGVNRWYVAEEHADLADAVAVPFNAIDAGEHGWVVDDHAERASARRSGGDPPGVAARADPQRHPRRGAAGGVRAADRRAAHGARRRSRARAPSATRARRPGSARAWSSARGARSSTCPARCARPSCAAGTCKHVTVNMGHLTDPAYLGHPPADVVGWIDPEGLPHGPDGGLRASSR